MSASAGVICFREPLHSVHHGDPPGGMGAARHFSQQNNQRGGKPGQYFNNMTADSLKQNTRFVSKRLYICLLGGGTFLLCIVISVINSNPLPQQQLCLPDLDERLEGHHSGAAQRVQGVVQPLRQVEVRTIGSRRVQVLPHLTGILCRSRQAGT